MRVRLFEERDLPALKRIYLDAGYSFDFPDFADPFVGHVQVLVSEEDVPLMAVCSKLVPEIILLCAPGGNLHPIVKMQGIGMIHEAMNEALLAEGHKEAFSFIPPEIEKSYGRHLMRKFGWLKTWAAFRIGGNPCQKA